MTKRRQLIANSKNKQPLAEHLFGVGVLSTEIFDKMGLATKNNKIIKEACLNAGILHDLGKTTRHFQNILYSKKPNINEDIGFDEGSKAKFENVIRHNETSWAICTNLFPHNSISDAALYAIYWHHPKKVRENQDLNSRDILENEYGDIDGARELVSDLIKEISHIYYDYFGTPYTPPNLLTSPSSLEVMPPRFRQIKKKLKRSEYKTEENSIFTVVRCCLLIADRIISSLTADQLKERISSKTIKDLAYSEASFKSDLVNEITSMKEGFERDFPKSPRNIKQAKAAEKLAKRSKLGGGPVVLQGPAGDGKTKTMLEYSANVSSQRIIWICPRLEVCLSIYNDLRSHRYLPNTEIEILTGTYKEISYRGQCRDTPDNEIFSGQIVVTTIDQIISSLNSHNHIPNLLTFLDSTIVFDEYHEISSYENMIHVFKDLIKLKEWKGSLCNTVLMSATPDLRFTRKFLGVSEKNIIRVKSFHQKKIQMKFECYKSQDDHPFLNNSNPDTIYISNMRVTAQRGYLNHPDEKSIVVHSAYHKKDSIYVKQVMMTNFGKDGKRDNIDILRAGPVVQASLNISSKYLATDLCGPENLIQRIGRNNRFSEHREGNVVIYYPEDIRDNPSQGKYLSMVEKSRYRAAAFSDYLMEKHGNRFKITLDELYDEYFNFYDSNHPSIDKDWERIEEKAIESLTRNDLFEPLDFRKSKKVDLKLPLRSLRGSGVYILPLTGDMKDGKFTNLKYLYNPNEEFNEDELINLPVSDYRLQSDDNLLNIYARTAKHLSENYSKYNSNRKAILNNARDPKLPIYVNYTNEDINNLKKKDQVYLNNTERKSLLFYVPHDKKNEKNRPVGIGLADQKILEEYDLI